MCPPHDGFLVRIGRVMWDKRISTFASSEVEELPFQPSRWNPDPAVRRYEHPAPGRFNQFSRDESWRFGDRD